MWVVRTITPPHHHSCPPLHSSTTTPPLPQHPVCPSLCSTHAFALQRPCSGSCSLTLQTHSIAHCVSPPCFLARITAPLSSLVSCLQSHLVMRNHHITTQRAHPPTHAHALPNAHTSRVHFDTTVCAHGCLCMLRTQHNTSTQHIHASCRKRTQAAHHTAHGTTHTCTRRRH
jgi:hypothetical protein